ncbi:acetyl-CoA carboxylase biotin carboxylase subunit family protein [Streptomyces sp. NPDC006641]|uniref:ATP-grasp domain-containing protein n=1 Tax=unclassified Streptomyces TaxID=2593676 RepID=UPI002E77F0A0|nr:ATP-grasp domain-containing protein [Streptomyces sp. JV184]MEE1750526.1 ATP-grasp domain-containing protein [Streptomyces sp. JV184]
MSGTLPRLGVLHAPHAAANLRDLVLAGRDRCEVVLVVRREVAAAEPDMVRLGRALATVEVIGDDVPRELAALGLDGLVTFHDAELEAYDAAVRDLGLPGATEVDHPWDKLVQRRLLNAAGVSTVRSAPVDSPEGLVAAAAEVGLPAVLKPRRGTASTDLSFLTGPADLEAEPGRRENWSGLVLEQMIERAAHPSGRRWLADYVSVETVTHQGEHTHVAVFDKTPLAVAGGDGPCRHAVRETGDVLPAQLPPHVYEAVLATTSAALDALTVRDRVSHTELRVSQDGVEVIEVNGRLGGEVAGMIGMMGGSGLVRAAFDLALGRRPEAAAPTRPDVLISLYVPFPERSGPVRSTVTRTQVRELPGVVRVDEVAQHGAARADTAFHAVKVLIIAPDADAAGPLVRTVATRVARLFEADGLGADPWLDQLAGDPGEPSAETGGMTT